MEFSELCKFGGNHVIFRKQLTRFFVNFQRKIVTHTVALVKYYFFDVTKSFASKFGARKGKGRPPVQAEK
jgi:hypothetical protein